MSNPVKATPQQEAAIARIAVSADGKHLLQYLNAQFTADVEHMLRNQNFDMQASLQGEARATKRFINVLTPN